VKILVALKRVSDPDNANKIKISPTGDRVETGDLRHPSPEIRTPSSIPKNRTLLTVTLWALPVGLPTPIIRRSP
jgi:hypothetical protein